MMTGAAIADDEVITGEAVQIVTALMRSMPLDALDAVYTRWLDKSLADPTMRPVRVNAHDLLSTWATIQAELARARAEDQERKAMAYRRQVEAELRKKPKALKQPSTAMLQMGIGQEGRPTQYPPGASEKPQEAREAADLYVTTHDNIEPLIDAVVDADYQAKLQRNRAAYLQMLAEAEHKQSTSRVQQGWL